MLRLIRFLVASSSTFLGGRAAILALMIALVAGALVAQQPRVPQNATRLVVHNAFWDSVRIELRVGKLAACENNTLVGERHIRRGRSWGVTSTEPLCWRREQAPGTRFAGVWSSWSKVSVRPGQIHRVNP